MKVLLSILVHLLVASTFIANGASVFDAFSSSLSSLFTDQEEAPFTSISKQSSFEERSYNSLKWICANETALKSSSKTQTDTFLQLFSYLKGENSRKEEIEMSVPVLIRYQKLRGASPTLAACFFVSQSNPPVPNNSNLTIYENEPMTIFTRQFGGFVDKPSEWLKEATSLVGLLNDNGQKVRRNLMFWTAFDSPVKFWNRRNEVWLIKRA